MFLLISQPMKHLNSLDRSYIFIESIAFWYMISKKCQNHSVIFHLWRLWRCIIEEIWKIHWKSTIKKTQCCFANISAMKAPIFTKFYMVVNYYLVSLCIKFHEDPCINARARVVNVRVHILSRAACIYESCAYICSHWMVMEFLETRYQKVPIKI